MICYRDRSYCSDMDNCDTENSECSRRLTDEDKRKAIQIGLPISWMSFKQTCGKFKEASDED